MIPGRHPNTTRYLGAPEGWEPEKQGECSHLSVADVETEYGPVMQSVWEPTPGELAQLAAGGKVVLQIVGTGHPPVALFTWLPA